MDIFSINKNHACLIYVLYITLQKLTILSLFPLGVMHHEPCFHAGSSTSRFLLGRIRKVSSLFLFTFVYPLQALVDDLTNDDVLTPDDARSPTLWYLGLENEILMLIAYAQKPPVNVHAAYLVGI